MALFGSASRLKRLVWPSFIAPKFYGDCLGRNAGHAERDGRSTSGDTASAMHLVDVNRFFVASERSSAAAADSPRLYVDDRSDDHPTAAASYVDLDVLRVALAVVDLFVVLHRCACLGYCSCCLHGDGQLSSETKPDSDEMMRNGVAGGSVVLCSKYDGRGPQQLNERDGRAPNGSAARSLSSFDVEENVDAVPDRPRLLRRRRRKGVKMKSALRGSVGGGVWRHHPTLEQRRRRRQLIALLTRLVLCSIVVSLVYIVVRSLDVILAELMTVAAKQSVVSRLLVTEIFFSDTAGRQVRRYHFHAIIPIVMAMACGNKTSTSVGLTSIHTCRSYVHTPRDFTNGVSLA